MSFDGHGRGFGAAHGAAGGGMRGLRGPKDPGPTTLDPDRPRDRHRVLALFKPYRARLAAVVGLIIASSAVSMISPFLLRAVLDTALPQRNGTLLTELVLGMIGIAVATGVSGVWQTYISNTIGQKVMHDLRAAVYRHLQRMSLAFFTRTRTGEVQSRIANDIGGIDSVVTTTATSVASNATTVIATIVAMAILDWRLAVASLIFVPPFVWLTRRVGQVRRRISTERQSRLADLSALVSESLSVSGIMLGKTMGRGRDLADRFTDESREIAEIEVRSRMAGRWVMSTIQMVFAIQPALVYWIAGQSFVHGISIGTVVAFTQLQTRLLFPIQSLLSTQADLEASLALFDRIFEYLDLPVDIVEAPEPVTLVPEQVLGEVRLEHVYFRYGAGESPGGDSLTSSARKAQVANGSGAELASPGRSRRAKRSSSAQNGGAANGAPAELTSTSPQGGLPSEAPEGDLPWTLHDVSLVVAPGTRTAIVGETGSGKTTLGYLVARLYEPQEGRVTIDGVDVREASLESLAATVGVVSQETYLFHESVRENLRFATPQATDAEIVAAARTARIHDLIVSLPEGYDTVVGERGYRFSGGEKQRMAIARTVLRNPPVLIFDEATSSLDTQTEAAVQAELERLSRGRTTITIAHRLSTVRDAEQIVVLDRGRIVERGTHEDLLDRAGAYAALVARDVTEEPVG
ncbi:MAG: ATP-binding cassette, subfamily bacterial [Solirubrobacteraceae bacterium]|nr:ATP-binding cassette, subfamily bacterial [Solirubrobacteraceae bacterium]